MRPLTGLTIVTFEHAIAAPLATRQLADLGARVIKIERPGVGDFARGYDTRVRGLASHFVWTNRSKESLTLDLKHPGAQSVLRKLILKRWRQVDRPAGVVPALLPPGAWDDEGPRMDPVPALGAHTDSILAELGYAAGDVAALRVAGGI